MAKVNLKSLPSRERGLKSFWADSARPEHVVAPFTGAWIEIRDTETLSDC